METVTLILLGCIYLCPGSDSTPSHHRPQISSSYVKVENVDDKTLVSTKYQENVTSILSEEKGSRTLSLINHQEKKVIDSASKDHSLTKNRSTELQNESHQNTPDDAGLKKILLWNKWLDTSSGRAPFLDAGCAVNTCLVTTDRNLYSHHQLDALVWSLFPRSKSRRLPSHRSPKTLYVFHTRESPMHRGSKAVRRYNGVFNWTSGYRLDSDVVTTYGIVRRKSQREQQQEQVVDIAKLVRGKTKVAAWFVSNCHTQSGRERLVQNLQQYIPVDVYGRCGNLTCSRRRKNRARCHAKLEREYKFYLAFENSLCRDYVTEKFFNVLKYYVVPVVWGLADYSRHGPPHSYIDASAFPSVQYLAEYLLYLHHNHTAYIQYFSWKTTMLVTRENTLCNLCQRLHDNSTKTKVYDDLYGWFNADKNCMGMGTFMGIREKERPVSGTSIMQPERTPLTRTPPDTEHKVQPVVN